MLGWNNQNYSGSSFTSFPAPERQVDAIVRNSVSHRQPHHGRHHHARSRSDCGWRFPRLPHLERRCGCNGHHRRDRMVRRDELLVGSRLGSADHRWSLQDHRSSSAQGMRPQLMQEGKDLARVERVRGSCPCRIRTNRTPSSGASPFPLSKII